MNGSGFVPQKVPYNYYIMAPVIKNGWPLIGEYSQWNTMSHQRFYERNIILLLNNKMVINTKGISNQWV